MEPIVGPADWRPQDFADASPWVYTLSAEEIVELERAVDGIRARGLDIKDATTADFVLPRFSVALGEIRDEVAAGRGFALIRGLPVARLNRAQVAAAFWGVGAHMGRAVSQNARGHLLGHVKDLGGDYGKQRGYFTSAHMAFHCDSCDILALACLHSARSGGEHMICSSVALYNEMLKRRPDLAKELTWRFYRSRSGEIPLGETEPWLRQGVFNFHEGWFAARGVSAAIAKAAGLPGVPPLTEEQREALQMFRDLAPQLAMEIHFEPGDMFFLSSHTTLHSRTAFEDWPEPERKRHLLRLWLAVDDVQPLPPDLEPMRKGICVQGQTLSAPVDV
jgi:hypothetical protein